MRKECEKCKGLINLDFDKYVLLGTYDGKTPTNETYFHWTCFKLHWEERIRVQSQAMVNRMAKGVMPIAKDIVSKITGVDVEKEVKIEF